MNELCLSVRSFPQFIMFHQIRDGGAAGAGQTSFNWIHPVRTYSPCFL